MKPENIKCPKCGGPMTSRTSQYGRFWGCNDYPHCRGIRNSLGEAPKMGMKITMTIKFGIGERIESIIYCDPSKDELYRIIRETVTTFEQLKENRRIKVDVSGNQMGDGE